MDRKRFVVFTDVTTAAELVAFASYVRKEFPDLSETRTFADSNEAAMGPLKILDRQTNQVVYVSRAGRHAGSLAGRRKPPWP